MTVLERPEYETELFTLRGQMDAAAFSIGWASGRAMTIEQAIRYAVE